MTPYTLRLYQSPRDLTIITMHILHAHGEADPGVRDLDTDLELALPLLPE